jgi:hypothetical protein
VILSTIHITMARTKQTARESGATKMIATKKKTEETKVSTKKTEVPSKKETKKTVVPPKKETKAVTKKETKAVTKKTEVPPKKETKASTKKDTKVVASSNDTHDLTDLEKRLAACEKSIKLALDEAASIRKDLDSIKNGSSVSVSDTKTKTSASENETTASVSGKDAPSEASEKEEKIDVKTLKRPELIAKLAELGINESDVKRGDGAKGKPVINDFRDALEKALKKQGKAPKKEVAKEKVTKKKDEPKEKVTKKKDEPKEKVTKKKDEPKEKVTKKKDEPKKEEEKSKKVKVDVHLDKGYGTDKNNYVYTLSTPHQVVAKLVNDKPTPLTAADIKELKSLEIPHAKKSAAELKTLLVPIKDADSDDTEVDISSVAATEAEETTDTTLSLVDSSDESSMSSDSSSDSISSGDASDTTKSATPKKEKKNVKVVEENESSLTKTEESTKASEKEKADEAAEGTENVKVDEEEISSSSSSDSSSDSGEGAEIEKNFEKEPEVTKSDFTAVYTAVTKKEINLDDTVKVNAKKLDMDESVVGAIIAKYKFYENKWPEVVKASKTTTTTTTKTTTTAKPGARQLLKPRK